MMVMVQSGLKSHWV